MDRPLTLGQLACAIGAPRRWVLNALTRLRVKRGQYDEALARRLSLARHLAQATWMPLVGAYDVAGHILAETDPHDRWHLESPDGAVRIEVDLPRFFTSYLPRLALALTHYQEKRRGRPLPRRGTAIERAQAWGMDTSLFEYTLSRTPSQRLEDLDANLEFYRRVKVRDS